MTPGGSLTVGAVTTTTLGPKVLVLARSATDAVVELSAREQKVLAEFEGYTHRRNEWLAGRDVCKRLLQLVHGWAPARVEVLPLESGAPRVHVDGTERTDLVLNLSHTRRYVAAAVHSAPVGIDLADDEDGAKLATIARRVMSDGEAEACGAYDSHACSAAVWAIKEAGLKLRIGGVFNPGARSIRVESLSPPRVADPSLALELFRLDGAALAIATHLSA